MMERKRNITKNKNKGGKGLMGIDAVIQRLIFS